MKYLLWSKLYKQFFRELREGLTLDIENAGRYSKEEAEKLIREIDAEVFGIAKNGSSAVVMLPAPESISLNQDCPLK